MEANRAFATGDQPLHHIEQLQKFDFTEAPELDVVDLPLCWRQFGQQFITLGGDLKLHPPSIKRIDRFVNQAALEQLVGNRGNKCSTEMKVAGNAVDIDIALLPSPKIGLIGSQYAGSPVSSMKTSKQSAAGNPVVPWT